MKYTLRALLCSTILSISAPSDGYAQIPAFPGAEGFAAYTQGGRGGKVILVTNLNDSGAGSFRNAVEQSGPRIVVFKVSGTINVKSSIDIEDPFITIAGQTAPGDGIALRNDGNTSATLKIKTHDVVIRHLRVRPGPGGEADGLALQGKDTYNIMVDHSSFSWGVDETVSFYTGDKDKKIHNVTFQDSIISDALDCSTHGEGCHSKGLLIQYADKVSVLRTLFANNGGRNPMILSGDIEVSNNVIYNWGGSAVKMENRHGDVRLNFVSNYLEPGKDSDMSENGIQVKTSGIKLHLKDNYASHVRPDNSYPEDAIVNYRASAQTVSKRFDFPAVNIMTPQQTYQTVLENSGATLPKRDRVDEKIVASVKNKTGRLIDSPKDVGGYPELKTYNVPKDSDNDGMPDDWEDANNLNKNDPSDSSRDKDNDGYTNIEEYINSLGANVTTEPSGGTDNTPTEPSEPENTEPVQEQPPAEEETPVEEPVNNENSTPASNQTLKVSIGDNVIIKDDNGNGGETVELEATVEGNAKSYEWKIGSSVVSRSKEFKEWLRVGVHTVKFTATDALGKTASETITVEVTKPGTGSVNTAPPLKVTIGDDVTVNDKDGNGGETIELEAKVEGDAKSYEWKIGSNVISRSKEFKKWLRVGTHTVTFYATDALGRTVSESITVEVSKRSTSSVNTVPELKVSIGDNVVIEDDNGNGGETVELEAKVEGDAKSYEWKVGSGIVSRSKEFKEWLRVGTHNVTFKATDALGRAVSESITVEISKRGTNSSNTTPALKVSIGDDVVIKDDNSNGGETVELEAKVEGDAKSYEWKLGSNVVSRDKEFKEWLRVGTHNVSFTATDSSGRKTSENITVEVKR